MNFFDKENNMNKENNIKFSSKENNMNISFPLSEHHLKKSCHYAKFYKDKKWYEKCE